MQLPGPLLPLVAHGNALLRRRQAPADFGALECMIEERPSKFHMPDGSVVESANDWLETVQEFHARRLRLVRFRVLRDAPNAPVEVEEASPGVWGMQVEYARRCEMWLRGPANGGRAELRGQPSRPALTSPGFGEAREPLRRALLRAVRSSVHRREAARVFEEALAILGGTRPGWLLDAFPAGHDDDARRLGEAGYVALVNAAKADDPEALGAAAGRAMMAAANC